MLDTTSEFLFSQPMCDLLVERLLTVHYFEYTSSFYFPGESHNFWELLYVDKGAVEVTANERTLALKKGEMVFHKPYEFHKLQANGVVAPNLIVVSFTTGSSAMEFFEERVLRITPGELTLLGSLIKEARTAYQSDLADPSLRALERSPTAPFGAEQLVKLYLEELLISMIRRGETEGGEEGVGSNIREHTEQDVVSRVSEYLERNLERSLSFDEICRENFIGRSYLQKIFKQKKGCGVMDYFSHLKITAAKSMIREGARNFTQIARALGFASIHYFSRRFKVLTGMTPSEYASSSLVITESAKTAAPSTELDC